MGEPRIQKEYLPLFFWVCSLLEDSKNNQRPLIIGVNGPQGCGKSTLTQKFVNLLSHVERRAITLSIDDFYLTHQQQLELATKYPANPYLQQRGYPGTHDIELGVRTLTALTRPSAQGPIAVPVYDKSKHQGRGDRLPIEQWKCVSGELDLIFLEGWMLGFSEVPTEMLPNESFHEINRMLKEYQNWYSFLDGFICLEPQETEFVVDWRVEAEEKMKALGKPGMSREEATAYVQKFLAAYEVYLPKLMEKPPVAKNFLKVTLQKNRLPI